MTFAVAICLLLGGGADPPTSDRPVAAWTDRDEASAVETVLEALDRDIEKWTGDPEMKGRLAQALATRGWVRMQKAASRQALADFDAALAIDPDLTYARAGRGSWFLQSGDTDRAQAEFAQIPQEPGAPPSFREFGKTDVSPEAAVFIVFFFWLTAFSINFAAGRTQQIGVAGQFARLVCVAACLGLIAVLPVAVWAMLLAAPHAGASEQFYMALGMTIISIAFTTAYLGPPIRLRGTKDKLPLVVDAAFLARVAELAQMMKVPVPVVRLWPTLNSSQRALAYAGTIQAPQLVVTDGILRRLSAVERDAIVAHELAHIANGSLWPIVALIPVSCAAATVASSFVPLSIAGALGMAFFVGLKRLVIRPLEFDCDRRAARVIGFRDTATALSKIHAVGQIPNAGLLSLLVYATATHPSCEVRLAALCSAAPLSDKPDVALPVDRIRCERLVAVVAFLVWLGVVAGSLWAALVKPELPWFIPLLAVTFAPTALSLLSQRKVFARNRKRLGKRPWWVTSLGLGVPIGVPLGLLLTPLISTEPASFYVRVAVSILLMSLALAGLVWLLWTYRRRKLRRDVLLALQVHDFGRALALGEANPALVARDYKLRHNVALARAVCGDRLTAILDLERLWHDKPRFPLAALTLGGLLLDADRPEQALEVARAVAPKLDDDALPPYLEAAALRRLGRLEEARAACQRAIALAPEDGTILALQAAIVADGGVLPSARQMIEMAQRLSPGAGQVMLIRAGILLEMEPPEEARVVVEEAIAAVRSNPLLFLQGEIRRLEQKLAERDSSLAVAESAASASNIL